MAKAYIDIVKYMVEAKFDISGLVDKPDVIGAVFGQTEGLLGGNLDLRELQKNGKIGRIEINSSSSGSKTYGKLFLPSSLGRVETCILAAAIESVDRVGPFETSFKIEKIEDTRSEKRKRVINRAKELVKTLLTTEIPDSRELSELVESDVKSSVIGTYGPENLPAGPDIAKSDEVMIVEGRADVITLLKNDISNCIAVGGASGTVPKTITDLCNQKEATVFIDGDRGGEMIVRNLIGNAELDYVAKAPDGKEVEELTRKEIIKALRSKVPIEQYLQQNKIKERNTIRNDREQRQEQERRQEVRQDTRPERQEPRQERQEQRQEPRQEQRQEPSRYDEQRRPQFQQRQRERESNEVLSPSRISSNLREQFVGNQRNREQEGREDKPMLQEIGSNTGLEGIPKIGGAVSSTFPGDSYIRSLEELHNTLRGRLYNKTGSLISEVPIRELIQSIQDSNDVYAIVFDGIITQRLIELAYKQGVKEIYGIRSSQISRTYQDLGIYTSEKGTA